MTITPLVYRVWSFFGITFDAHPHSGWFICLAPNGARRTESRIIKNNPARILAGFSFISNLLEGPS